MRKIDYVRGSIPPEAADPVVWSLGTTRAVAPTASKLTALHRPQRARGLPRAWVWSDDGGGGSRETTAARKINSESDFDLLICECVMVDHCDVVALVLLMG
ncbi:hypothetical protein E2562_011479 [Oryza meyeriana var. granulata]|uniref:Uncharacterized protein n=1 Tax=Oryza meyeriana var. granulata TaxID=110450 RepID=A0A6G1D285_9ORYZ|nr:hypothetical protein E2562_011479 [Oryza meyeriana var. granulata]